MITYAASFEHQRLPIGMALTEDAIELFRENSQLIQYYHNYYREEPRFQAFRNMVDENVRSGQIQKNNGS
jgi:hypothetical protein